MNCTRCGSEVSQWWTFCPECGAQISKPEKIALQSLCGMHKLSGVGRRGKKADRYSWCSTVNQFFFTLDDVTYVATEDENDGYRSCMAKLEILNAKPVIMFDPIDVVCHMQKDDNSDILEMIDIRNGKTVLLVGTDYYDSYYPCFISEWIPENLAVNGDKEE